MWRSIVEVVATLTLSLLTVPLTAKAQQAGGTVTIGYLGNASPALESNLVDAFREGLRQLGYVEGQNLVIRYQWAEGQQERHAVLASGSPFPRPFSSRQTR
jgi:putative ABC transport system substrate-binding protein